MELLALGRARGVAEGGDGPVRTPGGQVVPVTREEEPRVLHLDDGDRVLASLPLLV